MIFATRDHWGVFVKEYMTTFTIRLDQSTADDLVLVANFYERSKSDIVRRLIKAQARALAADVPREVATTSQSGQVLATTAEKLRFGAGATDQRNPG